MATKARHLRHLADWCSKHCEPVISALSREEVADAWAGLARARAALDDSTLSPDDHQALSLHLAFLEFLIQYNLVDHRKTNMVTWEDMYNRLKVETKGPVAKKVKAWLYLAVRLLGDTAGYLPLTEDELTSLYKKTEADDRDSELWRYVATWAVEHRSKQYIKLAYEEMKTDLQYYQRNTIWVKLNLLYLLQEGRAKQRDVLETIKVFNHPNQMRRFDEVIWPMIAEHQLDTEELRQAVALKRNELASTPMEAPRY